MVDILTNTQSYSKLYTNPDIYIYMYIYIYTYIYIEREREREIDIPAGAGHGGSVTSGTHDEPVRGDEDRVREVDAVVKTANNHDLSGHHDFCCRINLPQGPGLLHLEWMGGSR